jgi:hypothetical protein
MPSTLMKNYWLPGQTLQLVPSQLPEIGKWFLTRRFPLKVHSN